MTATPASTAGADDADNRVSHDVDIDVDVDVVVVGAGFGGLSAALTLAERGVAVTLLEALPYSGGCASTFERHGVRYEAGATLFSGLAPATDDDAGGFFTRALGRHGLRVDVDFADPVIEHRGPGVVVDVVRDRAAFVESFCVGASASQARGVRRFFARQHRVADLLWPLLVDGERLPLFTAHAFKSLGFHARRSFGYLAALPTLASLAGKSLAQILDDDGCGDVPALRSWCDSLCQIAVQVPAAEADAVFALCALDYIWRGTGHVHGGIGKLGKQLEAAIVSAGGRVCLSRKARRITRDDDGRFVVDTARGPLRARRLLLNLLPNDAARLLDVPLPAALAARQADVDDAWGAVMLYLVLRAADGASPAPRHLDIVDDTGVVVDGHHAFVSVSGADEGRVNADEAVVFGGGDLRTATVSTHIALSTLRELDDAGRAAVITAMQERLRAAVATALPTWTVLRAMPGSPRTFARYTGRHGGAVGGVPRRAGRVAWLDGAFVDNEIVKGAALIGDSVFPGQSTLAVAVGGARAAHRIADGLKQSQPRGR